MAIKLNKIYIMLSKQTKNACIRRGCIETRVYAPPYASVAAATRDDACPRPLLRLELLITDHGFFDFAKCHKQRRRQLVLIITNAKQSHPASTVLLIGSASFDLFRFVRRRDDIRWPMRMRHLNKSVSGHDYQRSLITSAIFSLLYYRMKRGRFQDIEICKQWNFVTFEIFDFSTK